MVAKRTHEGEAGEVEVVLWTMRHKIRRDMCQTTLEVVGGKTRCLHTLLPSLSPLLPIPQ
jgi:hypothetical protein